MSLSHSWRYGRHIAFVANLVNHCKMNSSQKEWGNCMTIEGMPGEEGEITLRDLTVDLSVSDSVSEPLVVVYTSNNLVFKEVVKLYKKYGDKIDIEVVTGGSTSGYEKLKLLVKEVEFFLKVWKNESYELPEDEKFRCFKTFNKLPVTLANPLTWNGLHQIIKENSLTHFLFAIFFVETYTGKSGDLLTYVNNRLNKSSHPHVRIGTIHIFKGIESQKVMVIGDGLPVWTIEIKGNRAKFVSPRIAADSS